MKLIRLLDGTWEWRVRFTGMIGQASGFAPTRGEALERALDRIDEELLQSFLITVPEA